MICSIKRKQREDWRGQIVKVAEKAERKKWNTYVFFSFDSLVGLLNTFQVLKIQLHQAINLETKL